MYAFRGSSNSKLDPDYISIHYMYSLQIHSIYLSTSRYSFVYCYSSILTENVAIFRLPIPSSSRCKTSVIGAPWTTQDWVGNTMHIVSSQYGWELTTLPALQAGTNCWKAFPSGMIFSTSWGPIVWYLGRWAHGTGDGLALFYERQLLILPRNCKCCRF